MLRECSSAFRVLHAAPLTHTDTTFLKKALGEGCPGLQRLDMTGCDSVTDVGLAWMSNGCPALEHLQISGCVKVGQTCTSK